MLNIMDWVQWRVLGDSLDPRMTVYTRSLEETNAFILASGRYTPREGEIVPNPKTSEAREAWARLSHLIKPLAPKVLKVRLWGAVGDVTWGSTGNQPAVIDERLDLEDLRLLAHAQRGFEQMFTTGIVAFWAHTDMEERSRISRLSGYLEPIRSLEDMDQIVGMVQAWRRGNGWITRWFDFENRTLKIWKGVSDPIQVMGLAAHEEFPLEHLPHLAISASDAYGFPVGEMVQGSGYILSEMAARYRLHRLAEMYGFPTPFAKGLIKYPDIWQPGAALEGTGPDADFKFVEHRGLESLEKNHEHTLEGIRDFFAMPYGSLGGQTPSGEALAHANETYNKSSAYYSILLSDVLSRAVEDYAALEGISEAPDVEVVQGSITGFEKKLDVLVGLYKEGIIPLAAAARVAQKFVPGWSDEEVDDWVNQQSGKAVPAEVEKVLGGEGSA